MATRRDDGREWSDAPDGGDVDPTAALSARVVPRNREPTQIVLNGRCPRCAHCMTSVHTVRGPLTPERAFARFAADEGDEATTEDHAYRVIATRCQCAHEHPKTPPGERGCGAPIALALRWPMGQPGAVLLRRATAEPFEHLEERELQETLTSQLAQVRKAAESWRTGLGAFLAVLAAVFFVKGATSFGDLARGWQWVLAVLLLASAGLALYAAYRAIRAAYGTPADEYLAGGGAAWRSLRARLPATTPRHIHDYDTVGAWRDALARQSVTDLRHAKIATVFAAVLFAAAAAVTWLAPGPVKDERVVVQTSTRSVCGKTVAPIGGVLVVDGGEQIPTRDVVSIKPVSACPSR